MDIPLRVLIIEDSDRDVALEVRALEAAGYRVTYAVAETAVEMKAALIKQAFDIVISDHDLPQFDAPGALTVLKQGGLDIPFIIVSGAIGEETAVALMKAGAHDYVMKDRLSRLASAVERALKDAESLNGRKQAEATLIEVEKMGALGTLTAGIAHELNNPMMGMLNFVQYCLKHTPEDNRIYPVLQDIERETRRCVEIVKNLLTFSRLEKEKEEEYRQCNIALVLERIFKLLAYRIEKENVLINQHMADGIPECWIKENNMQQVFLNIIGNALDAVRESDRKEIRIEVTRDGKLVLVTVSDTGCGIPLENKPRIFDPFFTTKPVGKGTGLGLSVCHGIMRAHGGKISCESSPGAGTRFEIVVPIDCRGKRPILDT